MRRYLVGAFFVLLALVLPTTALASQAASPDRLYFSQTGHSVASPFLGFWEAHGSVAVFGYPESDAFVDPNTGFTTQYFERAVFEYHPNAPDGWTVQLRRIGAELVTNRESETPFQPAAAGDPNSCTFFAETTHNLCFGFRDYWHRHDGLRLFGYPLSEEFVENGHVVQYFERARFEWWPQNTPPYDILLGRLGVEIAAQNDVTMSATPTLQILAPKDGATLTLPATIHYEITGFPSGLPAGLSLRVEVVNLAEPIQLDLPITGADATAQIPNDKRLTGQRDLRFQLIGSTGASYTNPSASVTVKNLLILGGR